MAEEGVVEATWTEAKLHPWLIGGAVAAIVLVLWWNGRAKTQPAQNFTFSYGPSDAQVQAGTALAIAQQADQTNLAKATIQAGTDQDYFNYLATASNNNSTNQFNADFFNAQVASGQTSAGIVENAQNNAAALAAAQGGTQGASSIQ